ncbi:MAG: tetratricopeptide repeat protein [Candidatus Obscuribacterales bacterium]|nr:tetratricopeptide repeat protein [Candidatus Obscuribacterales bacterium]
MPELSALEHLKIAKRYHFQGMTDDAIREYEAVLELDPDNSDAIAGLRALGIEPVLREDHYDSSASHAGGLKTNFFANQAKSSTAGGVRAGVFKWVVIALGLGGCYGLYFLATYLLNYDNITAKENVEVHFEKPQMKDNNALVNIEIINLNPAPIKHMKISFRIADPTDTTLKEGIVELPGQVPAGDRRTFAEVTLGEVKGVPAKLSPKLEELIYGPKPKIKDKFVDQFMKAAAVRDKDALSDYEQLVTDTEDEEFAPARVGLGRAYAAKGDFDEALKHYQKAMELDPMNANAHYYAAVALFYKGDKEQAKKEIEQAARIAPDDPEIAWNLKYLFAMKDKTANGSKDADDKKTGKDETSSKSAKTKKKN